MPRLLDGDHVERVARRRSRGSARTARPRTPPASIPPTRATTRTSSWYASTSTVMASGSLPIDSSPGEQRPDDDRRARTRRPPGRGTGCRRAWAGRSRRRPRSCVTTCTSMSPDSRITVLPMPGPVMRGREPAAAADPDHDLRGVDRPREPHQRARARRRRPPGGTCRRAARAGPAACRARRGAARAGRRSSSRARRRAPRRPTAGGDAGAAAQQGLALGATGQGDEHALAGLPPVLDAVFGAVGA